MRQNLTLAVSIAKKVRKCNDKIKTPVVSETTGVCLLAAPCYVAFAALNRRSRRLFETTETELVAIAAEANMGFIKMPQMG